MAKKKLTDIAPREHAGRDTIKRYDYQFRKAAEACLRLLDDSSIERVYCDYHDDYILKVVNEDDALYMFHQVKTKAKDGDRWGRADLFGIKKKGAKDFKLGQGKNSIAGKLFYHHINFGASCKSVHIVTNAHFEDEIQELLDITKEANTHDELIVDSKLAGLILDFFQKEFDQVDPKMIFEFLRKLELNPNAGKLNDTDSDQEAIYLGRIYKYTEVSLDQAQAKQIASSLIDLVRKKSMKEIPHDISEKDLEEIASIEFGDVLNILSISKAAYDELKAGGDEKALKSASVLQRLLKRCGATEAMVIAACKAKVAWDNWIRNNRHIIGASDYFALEARVKEEVDRLATGNFTLADLYKNLSLMPKILEGKLPSANTLNVDLIFGLFWAIVVKEELF